MENYINYIYGVLGLIIGFIVPVVVRKSRVLLAGIKGKLGATTYGECETFVLGLAQLHPEDFIEDKIADVLDLVDNKFGNHLSKDDIRKIVNTIADLVKVDVAKAIV